MSYQQDKAQQRQRGGGVRAAACSSAEKGFSPEFTALSSGSRRRRWPHGIARELCGDSEAHGNHAAPARQTASEEMGYEVPEVT